MCPLRENHVYNLTCILFVLYSVCHITHERCSANSKLEEYMKKNNNNNKRDIAAVTCRQSIFIVFDVCNCFPCSIGINFKQLYISKGAKHTDVSVSNIRFRFLPYKRRGSIKGNFILHNIAIATGPHAETRGLQNHKLKH